MLRSVFLRGERAVLLEDEPGYGAVLAFEHVADLVSACADHVDAITDVDAAELDHVEFGVRGLNDPIARSAGVEEIGWLRARGRGCAQHERRREQQ